MTESSDGTLGTEEDEDDLLKEDIQSWDVFDDYHKFQIREQKIKDRKRQIANQERMVLQRQRTEEIEMSQTQNLEKDIADLETKLKA